MKRLLLLPFAAFTAVKVSVAFIAMFGPLSSPVCPSA